MAQNKREQTEQVKRPSKLTTCMITQSVLPKHWRWTAAELAALDRGESIASLILKRFRAAGLTVLLLEFVIHDHDTRRMWDEYRVDFRYIPAHEHVHILVKFKDGATREKIANIAGVAPEWAEPLRAGKFSLDGARAYLTHCRFPRKYNYPPQSVVTLVGQPYMDYYAANIERWLRTRYQRIVRNAETVLNEIKVRIFEDGLDRKGLVSNEDYERAYYFHKTKIDGWLRDKQDIDNVKRYCRQSED